LEFKVKRWIEDVDENTRKSIKSEVR